MNYRSSRAPVLISGFEASVHVITSKQRPRKITIRGSDGANHVFLLKGHEDLRLDERVMQVRRSLSGPSLLPPPPVAPLRTKHINIKILSRSLSLSGKRIALSHPTSRALFSFLFPPTPPSSPSKLPRPSPARPSSSDSSTLCSRVTRRRRSSTSRSTAIPSFPSRIMSGLSDGCLTPTRCTS